MSESYSEIEARVAALIDGIDDEIAVMATIACELFHSVERYHWVGFYRVTGPEMLLIGPYQGGHGCLSISFARGVCGKCARDEQTVIVDDVETFEGHIACASSTRSEIVVPVFGKGGDLIAVLDVDSDDPAAFDAQDAAALERMCAMAFSG